MFSTQPLNPFPLESLIASCGALDKALSLEQFPQARHHARVVALRGNGAGFREIAACAQQLVNALEQAIRPAKPAWGPVIERLHQAIDQALLALPPEPTE